MRANEKLTALMELEANQRRTLLLMKSLLATQFAPQGSHAEQSKTEQRNCRAAIGHPMPTDDEREVLVR